MKPKHKRLINIILILSSVSLGLYLITSSFKDNLIFFYSSKDLASLRVNDAEKFENLKSKRIRVGGLVKKESYVEKEKGSHEFILTDNTEEIKVKYSGILPPIFREEQGIISEGKLATSSNGELVFEAETLITKHDENYMPPEIKNAIEESDHPTEKTY